MKRSHRLQKVLQLSAEKESEAARVLAEAGRKIEEVQCQLESMQRFRKDYSVRMGEQGMALNGLQLHEYRSFLANLGRAIEEQEALLVKMRQEYAALQHTWRQAHCRNKGISKVQKKWVRFEQDCLEKQSQRELDDRAAAKRRKIRVK